jgi:enamine deaminase RidA (YjgF/YER057c/UK114 family)
VLLIAGTASVVGQDSRHSGDLSRQIDETFENLGALGAAWGARHAGASVTVDSLRVYFVQEEDLGQVVQAIMVRFPWLESIEAVQADVCRPELLVEIECTIGVRALVSSPSLRDAPAV